MSVKVTTVGNGKFVMGDQSDVVIDYSISESASPMSMADTSGEIPALTISAESNSIDTLGNTHPNSKLLIDNSITIVDDLRGTFTGRVSTLSADSQSVSIQALSIFEKLNTTKRAASINGTVTSAVQSYMALAGIDSSNYSIDSSFNSQSVVFPGWNDNIWNSLKMLCVAINAEMYFQSNVLYFKPRATKTLNVENIDGESFSIELGQQTKSTVFTRNKTSWTTGGIVFAYHPQDSVESIEANELKEFIVTSSVALNSINQPEYADAKFSTYVNYIQPTSTGQIPTEYLNGFYSFITKTGTIVPDEKALEYKASVRVELTDNPYEIKVIVTGPNTKYNTPWSLQFKDKEPALAFTGTGAFVQPQQIAFNTGTSVGDDSNEYTDNPFLVNDTYLNNTAYYTNQELCGPVVTFSFATDKIEEASNQEFGYLPGAIFSYEGSKYRITNASYGYGSISVDAKQYVTFADFNTIWAGKTIAQFNSTMLDQATYPDEYMKYSDLAILPLMEPAA
jgi:hypothetical protein